MPARKWDAETAVAFVLSKHPGAVPQEPYPGLAKPWRWTCPEGHPARPSLVNMSRLGTHLCKKCSATIGGRKQRTDAAEAVLEVAGRFLAATPAEPYPGRVNDYWRWKCSEGHDCVTTLERVRMGRHICRHPGCKRYAGPRRITHDEAVARMRERYPAIEVSEPFPGGHRRWRMMCERGHECSPRASLVWSGQGMCETCEALNRGDALRHTHASATRVLQARARLERVPYRPIPARSRRSGMSCARPGMHARSLLPRYAATTASHAGPALATVSTRLNLRGSTSCPGFATGTT